MNIVMYVLSKTITPLCNEEIGKALGLYHTIIWIKDLQLANVDFEVDLKKVFDNFARRAWRHYRIWCYHGCLYPFVSFFFNRLVCRVYLQTNE